MPMGEMQEKDIVIFMEDELSRYNLDGKWNDYVGVQKCIVEKLRNEGFFNNIVINKKSGMMVKITTKGIKETLGKGKRFQNLPKKIKQLKIATLNHLHKIIKYGTVLEDDVPNIHGNIHLYAYIIIDITVDEIDYGVRVAIRKRTNDNVFWIHNVDCKEKVSNYSTSNPTGKAIKEI